MSLIAGARLGPHEILSALGAGGMGEVYRARDSKLNRDVALKILPESFANDPDRLARFQREAQVLASLNHPNIAAIYGLEEANGIRALVLELVEGPTLADRIAQGPVPLDEALPIARQIAEALEAAHEHGIIHRDLKPANIKLRHDGTVKVLDFGLAKLTASEPGGAGEAGGLLSQSPTITTPAATRLGVIMGTAAYMSPEQARGKVVDKRADIWAFGCVLFEMLTGRSVFPGSDVSEVLAGVIKSDPAWSVLPTTTPPAIRRLLSRCLDKDPRERLRDIGDARQELRNALTTPAAEAAATAMVARRLGFRWQRVAALLLALLLATSIGGTAVWLATRRGPPRVSRFTITPPSAAALTVSGFDRDVAITPDGTRVVYSGANGSALFVRALDQLDATQLTGLGVPRGPFLSPDSQWIGFADGTAVLKKVALSGGPAVLVGRLDSVLRGATWGPDDTIVFATNNASTGLQQIPAGGGAPTVLTRPNRAGGEADHLWPEFLPDGEAVLFTITATTGGLDAASIAVLDLRTGAQTVLIRGGSHARYVQSGHFVYAAAGTLRAVPFDLANRAVIGPSVPVVPGVVTTPTGAADAVVADDGTLIYVPGSVAATERTLVWVDRQGHEEPIKAPARPITNPRLSPDGTRVALDVRDPDNADIWIWDTAHATLTRVTFDPGQDSFPIWTPDGKRLVFSSDQGGRQRNLFWQAANGTGSPERLTQSPNAQIPHAISPDGTQVIFREDAATYDLMLLTLGKERRTQPAVQTPFNERNGDISPDGRWLAYQSDESGQDEIYVRPFPDVAGGRWQISTEGGTRPVWARNGQELFYLATARGTAALMTVPIQRGSTWTAGRPTKLFEGGYFYSSIRAIGDGRTYDVSPDGKRFLMIKSGGGSDQTAAPASIVVVQNWFEELKRLVPVN